MLGLATIDAMGGYKLGDAVNYREFMELANLDETMAQGLFAYYAGMHGATEAVTTAPEEYRVPIIDLFLFLHDKAETGEFEVSEEQLALIRNLYDQLSMASDQLQGKNYSRLVLQLKLPVEGEETFAFIDRAHVIAEQYYPADEIVTVGNATNSYDFQKSFEQDNLVVTLASLLLVMLILLFTFRSLGMPILLILVIQGSICINFAIARLLGSWVFFNCYLIVTAIQMGANIDYAIVISSRFNELRAKGADSKEAMTEALNFVFPTIITSGTIMVVARRRHRPLCRHRHDHHAHPRHVRPAAAAALRRAFCAGDELPRRAHARKAPAPVCLSRARARERRRHGARPDRAAHREVLWMGSAYPGAQKISSSHGACRQRGRASEAV